jgi:uncharacterized protein YndB with AHSA1/START domain
MTFQATETSVRASVIVEAPIERAFSVFTDDIGSWWNPDHHIIEAELAEMVFEPREGGHVYDRGVDGSECRWARVLVYDPPSRLVISWDVNTQWKPEGEDRTRVDLEHRNLDRHGEGWEQIRAAVGSPEGWPQGLQDFAERVDS